MAYSLKVNCWLYKSTILIYHNLYIYIYIYIYLKTNVYHMHLFMSVQWQWYIYQNEWIIVYTFYIEIHFHHFLKSARRITYFIYYKSIQILTKLYIYILTKSKITFIYEISMNILRNMTNVNFTHLNDNILYGKLV